MTAENRGGRRRRPVSRRAPAEASLPFLAIAQIQAPHGVRGEFRARILTDFPERFKALSQVYLGDDHRPCEVESVRVLPDGVLLKLRGIDSPEAARELAQQLISIPTSEAMPLAEDQYFWYEIIGLAVWTTDERYLGEVADILATGSNDVYVVKGPDGEVLVPAIEDVVQEVDLTRKRLTIRLMEGML